MAKKKSYSTIITISYASIYAFIFLMTSIISAIQVRKIRKLVKKSSANKTSTQSTTISKSKQDNEEMKYDNNETIELETKSNGMFDDII